MLVAFGLVRLTEPGGTFHNRFTSCCFCFLSVATTCCLFHSSRLCHFYLKMFAVDCRNGWFLTFKLKLSVSKDLEQCKSGSFLQLYISFVWTMDSVRYDSKEERCFNLLKWMPIKWIIVSDSHAIVIYVHPNFVTLVACWRFRFSANATPIRIQSNFFHKSVPWVAPWTPCRVSCAKVQYERFVFSLDISVDDSRMTKPSQNK